MNIVVLGAAGKLGQRVVEAALARGHAVTAAVRDTDRFVRARGGAPDERLRIVQADAMDVAALEGALAGQDAAVSTAGNVADGSAFCAVFDRVVTAAERVMGGERRVWMLAGAAVLDIPQAGRIGLDLPFMPALYRPHLENWRRIERSGLDWALMCPGPLAADGGGAARGVVVAADALPFAVGTWARLAPSVALALMVKRNLPRISVTYESVATALADHLAAGGAFRRKRVGIGWAGTRA